MIRGCLFFLVIFLINGTYAQNNNNESEVTKNSAISDTSLKLAYNPFLVSSASLIVPGAGQMLTRHYIKAGTFLALEAITTSVAVYWFNDAKLQKDNTHEFQRNMVPDTGITGHRTLDDISYSQYSERFSRYRAYNALAWAASGYLYNFFDALQCSNFLHNSGERNPVTAGWLSAVPGLGLGQWYNGSLSKAGLVLMVQTSLGVTALNYHRLMKKAEREIEGLDSTKVGYSVSNELVPRWDSERRNDLKARNSFLWYSIFWYFYGIFDAVVDAHLHDYPEKMRLYPDLVPQGSGAQVRLNVKF